MASTSKNWTGVNSWVSARLVVTSVANALGNYSDVTAILYGARNDGGTSYNANASNFWININGTKTSRTSGCTVSGTGWTQVHSQTTRVYHNDDGSKTISVGAGGGITETTFQMGSASVSLALDKIARKSGLTVANGTLGTALVLTIDRKASDYTDSITYECGDVSGTICTKTSETELTFTPPIDFAKQNTTGTQVSVKFVIETFSGTTSLGTSEKTIVCDIPESVVPTISLALSDPNGFLSTFGKYVQGQSTLKGVITASGAYGSTISAYKTTADGSAFTEDTFTTEVIKGSGTLEIVATVTDSRGRTATITKTISVYEYAVPKISAIKAKRSDSSGSSSSSGEYLALVFSATVTSLDSKNTADYKVEYKKTSATSYTANAMTSFDGQYSIVDGVFVFSADVSSSYDIILTVTDAFGNVSKSTIGGTAMKAWSMFKRGLGFAFGKIAELENTLEVAFYGLFKESVKMEKELDVAGQVNANGGMAVTGEAKFNDLAILANAKSICGMTTDDSVYGLVGVNTSDYSIFGYGGYSASKGRSVLYGNQIRLIAKNTVRITSPTAGLSARAYGVNNILWSGGAYMNASTTATLSEAVSAQPHGIVLVFSRFVSGASANYDFVSVFVPKWVVAQGTWYHTFQLASINHTCIGTKFLQISDTTINGEARNENTGTSNGVTYANNGWVLRYVIGV